MIDHSALESQGWERLADSGFVELVGPLWRRREPEGWVYGLLAEPKHHNRRNILQGGMMMTFLDKCLGGTVREANNDSSPQTTVQLDVHFIDAAQIGEFLEARGRVVRMTRYIAFVEGEVTAGSRVVATAKGMWRLLAPRADGPASN
jgi:acyl-coenzyme A thioesterase PaaI-like protein